MKKLQIFIILFPFLCFSQDKITVSKGTKDTYIETYQYYSYNDSYSIKEAYRLGPSSAKLLKDAISTSIKWSKLNEEHEKKFEKEIVRFKVMDKESYKFHGYVDKFTEEFTLIFRGYEDGIFEVIIKKYDGFGDFIKIDTMNQLVNFQDLLNGKSANNEIDDVFKN
ncbi:hypothetical protein QLS31_12175 [Flavobacterium sp. XS2P24]|uniref:hypothetical protein n=1 Tax=Flavobacterium sp. XS2P24 TaxID=3041249 RepID=UPI0024A99DF4|nr:hypothetical protein [Flavobacterium sp. XS2P24]MDI6050589.1 hypothetical protein [Flavobacterium sp. XS2P24]